LSALQTSARLVAANLRPVLGPTVAVSLAFLVGAAVLVATQQSPIDVAGAIYEGAFGSSAATLTTLAQTTPLLLVALSFAFAFRAGVFNAGGQGQFLMGAFAGAWAGFTPGLENLPAIVHVPLVMLAGALGGALWTVPPFVLKVVAGANEILTTLMMSYVADLANQYLVLDIFRSAHIQAGTNAQTPNLVASARFPELVAGSHLTIMLFLALAAAVGVWLLYRNSVLGFELRLMRTGALLARSSGVQTSRRVFVAMTGSGALAGLAGVALVTGFLGADITPLNTNVGFNGILASLLVSNSPLLIPFAALFFAALEQGGIGLQIFTSTSPYIADVVIATVIVFASARTVPALRPKRLLQALRAMRPQPIVGGRPG
jgi:general nucleoside transport system permease protein